MCEKLHSGGICLCLHIWLHFTNLPKYSPNKCAKCSAEITLNILKNKNENPHGLFVPDSSGYDDNFSQVRPQVFNYRHFGKNNKLIDK